MEKKLLRLTFPDSIKFSDLHLGRDRVTGGIIFDWDPIELICQHSGVDSDIFRNQTEDNVAGLITSWYAAHLERGGAHDPIADELIEEVAIEDALGLPEIKTPGGVQ